MEPKKNEEQEVFQSIVKPGVPYDWSEDTIFQLTGTEFGVFFKIAEDYINSAEYARAIAMSKLHAILVKKMEGGIIAGTIKERTAPQLAPQRPNELTPKQVGKKRLTAPAPQQVKRNLKRK